MMAVNARITQFVVGSLMIPLMTGCGSATSAPSVGTPKYRGTVVRVRMVDVRKDLSFAYAPSRVVVRRTDRVVWANRSSQPHTVTATKVPREFNSGTKRLIASHHTWAHVFRQTGEYRYFCLVHPFMKAIVVVR